MSVTIHVFIPESINVMMELPDTSHKHTGTGWAQFSLESMSCVSKYSKDWVPGLEELLWDKGR